MISRFTYISFVYYRILTAVKVKHVKIEYFYHVLERNEGCTVSLQQRKEQNVS